MDVKTNAVRRHYKVDYLIIALKELSVDCKMQGNSFWVKYKKVSRWLAAPHGFVGKDAFINFLYQVYIKYKNEDYTDENFERIYEQVENTEKLKNP